MLLVKKNHRRHFELAVKGKHVGIHKKNTTCDFEKLPWQNMSRSFIGTLDLVTDDNYLYNGVRIIP